MEIPLDRLAKTSRYINSSSKDFKFEFPAKTNFEIFFDKLITTFQITDQTTEKENMILCGGAFGIFATISAMCNR